MKTMNRLVSALLSVLLPERCLLCSTPLLEGERHLCLNCLSGLPRLDCHAPFDDNIIVDRLLSHKAPLTRAVSFMRYERGGNSAHLIHEIKYNGRPSAVGSVLESHVPQLINEGFFNGID